MDLKERCSEYFAVFSAKDISSLSSLYADAVSLTDWDIDVSGKQATLDANRELFQAVDSLEIETRAMYRDGDTVACEISIVVDKSTTLAVVDVLQFDELGMIRSIRAYKA